MARRHPGRRARGRLHAVRGRRHRPRAAGRRAPDHRRREQRPELAVDPARHRRGHARRPAPALLPRLLQLRRPAPLGLALRDAAVVRQGRDGRDRPRRLGRDRRATRSRPRGTPEVRVALRDAGGAEVARATGAAGSSRSRTCIRGGPARATCTTSTSSCGATPLVDAYTLAVGIRTVEVDGTRFLINGEPFHFQRLRQARGQRGARQGPRRRVHGPRLRADGVDRRQLVPHLALPLRRGGPRLRRPARRRRDRRDRRGRPQHGHLDLRHPGRADLLRRDRQRRHAGRAPPGDPRARRARQEPPLRRAVEHRQRARVQHAGGARLLRAAGGRDAAARPDPARRLHQHDAGAARAATSSPTSSTS